MLTLRLASSSLCVVSKTNEQKCTIKTTTFPHPVPIYPVATAGQGAESFTVEAPGSRLKLLITCSLLLYLVTYCLGYWLLYLKLELQKKITVNCLTNSLITVPLLLSYSSSPYSHSYSLEQVYNFKGKTNHLQRETCVNFKRLHELYFN